MKTPDYFRYVVYCIIISSVAVTVSCKKKENAPVDPTCKNGNVTYLGRHWAILNAVVNPNSNTVGVSFDYGLSTDYTNSIQAIPGTLTGSSNYSVYASITGLKASTKYYYAVKVTLNSETFTAVDSSFTTNDTIDTPITFNPGVTYGTVADIDQNIYKTLTIGAQTWMAENLRTTRFNNGDEITYVPYTLTWSDSTTKSYCWYHSDSVNYGALYKWAAVSNGNLCPAGWHVPSDGEWTTMINFLGGDTSAARKLMETGGVHWETTSYTLTNESGFTAIPGGYRSSKGIYSNIKRSAYWWSSTEAGSINAYCRNIYFGFNAVTRTNSPKASGLSVRCLKD